MSTLSPMISGNEGKAFKAGTPDVELEITKWTYKPEVDTDRFATSKSAPGKRTIPGNKSGTGTLEAKRTTDANSLDKLLHEGDVITVKLMFENSTPTGKTGQVVIKDLEFDVDVDAGTAQSVVCNFETDGLMVDL